MSVDVHYKFNFAYIRAAILIDKNFLNVLMLKANG